MVKRRVKTELKKALKREIREKGIVAGMSRERMKGWEGQVCREGAATPDGEREVKKSADRRTQRI